MADLVVEMIKNSLNSFIRNDLNMAEEVRRWKRSPTISNEQIFRELLTFMMEDSKTIHRSLNDYAGIKKNLERIADHAKGIADMVTYNGYRRKRAASAYPVEERNLSRNANFF